MKYVAEFGCRWKEFKDLHAAERWLDDMEAITGKTGYIEYVKDNDNEAQ